MKVCGNRTSVTDRGRIGNALEESLSENTQVIGLKIKDTAEALFSAPTEIGMMDFGLWEIHREREE